MVQRTIVITRTKDDERALTGERQAGEDRRQDEAEEEPAEDGREAPASHRPPLRGSRSDYGENSRAISSRSRWANSASRDLARRWPIAAPSPARTAASRIAFEPTGVR